MLKTHSCGEHNKQHVGTSVTLSGWVDRRRDHGGLIFIDLRDWYGMVQVVFNPEISGKCHAIASDMRSEYVISVSGKVALRPAGTENLKIPTGEIEIIANAAVILSPAETPPFYINEDIEVDENLRLKYRYLDLRRNRMKNNLVLRHRTIKFIRDFLDNKKFIEVETPILTKSTPEGARDYLVPSRVHPGEFYALPQSPQQMKQLLMVAGLERYFQIARCFRDEDTRADRQPEFTQLDLEMSFVEEEDILHLMEKLFTSLAEEVTPHLKLEKPFPRLTYTVAMELYGTDKPDLRFGLELRDLSDIAKESQFSIFRSIITEGGLVKGLCALGCANYTRSQLEELNGLARELGAKGLVTIALGTTEGSLEDLAMDQVKSVIAKFLTLEQVKEMAKRLGAKMGDLLLLVAGETSVINPVLAEMRQEMGRRLELADPNQLNFAFVTGFPLLWWDKVSKRWQSEHHPFTSPREEDMALFVETPEKVRGRHYDMICNGFEIGGGSIRIHTAEMQRKIFRLLGYSDDEINTQFGHMLEAFGYGAPPHGGIALGMDRIVMLLAGEKTIREVIPFPKNQNAQDLTFNAPSPVSREQLSDLHLQIKEE
ncbi:aspartate--tRNA ligase [Chloroflexota bacterium]